MLFSSVDASCVSKPIERVMDLGQRRRTSGSIASFRHCIRPPECRMLLEQKLRTVDDWSTEVPCAGTWIAHSLGETLYVQTRPRTLG